MAKFGDDWPRLGSETKNKEIRSKHQQQHRMACPDIVKAAIMSHLMNSAWLSSGRCNEFYQQTKL